MKVRVSICDAKILDELNTSRGAAKVRNLSFKEDKRAQNRNINTKGRCNYDDKICPSSSAEMALFFVLKEIEKRWNKKTCFQNEQDKY
nr:boron transporter 4-like [Tanacetum cinerariifolium]